MTRRTVHETEILIMFEMGRSWINIHEQFMHVHEYFGRGLSSIDIILIVGILQGGKLTLREADLSSDGEGEY